jgi:uncharacterized repeat protein (TIGR01451 family)
MFRFAGKGEKTMTNLKRTMRCFALIALLPALLLLTLTQAIAFTRTSALTLNPGEDLLGPAALDATNGYAYFGTYTTPGQVVKVRLSDFTRVGAITLNSGEDKLRSAVLDATNGYAYFGTNTTPSQVIKVRLPDFTRVDAITLNSGEDFLPSALLDATNGYAYFGTHTTPGKVVKVQLQNPQLALSKSVNRSSAKPGEAITYTIAFSNTGDATAANVVITDDLSANISGASVSSSGVTITQAPGSRYIWQVQDLLPNQGGVITITGVLSKPLAAGVFTNTATMAASGAVTTTAQVGMQVQNVAPMADAGPDQSRDAGQSVTLDGSQSSDDNGDALTYAWTQTGGSPVTFTPNTSMTTFTAPGSPVLTFTLTVTDTASLTGTDEVVVRVMHGTYLPMIFKTPL